jgi:hypothetical protein
VRQMRHRPAEAREPEAEERDEDARRRAHPGSLARGDARGSA